MYNIRVDLQRRGGLIAKYYRAPGFSSLVPLLQDEDFAGLTLYTQIDPAINFVWPGNPLTVNEGSTLTDEGGKIRVFFTDAQFAEQQAGIRWDLWAVLVGKLLVEVVYLAVAILMLVSNRGYGATVARLTPGVSDKLSLGNSPQNFERKLEFFCCDVKKIICAQQGAMAQR